MTRSWDDYFWPGEKVLRNKLDEHGFLALQAAEYRVTAYRDGQIARGEIPIARTFDTAHLNDIHRALFSDVYDWAGEIRAVPMSKNGIAFATPDRIGIYLNDVARVVRETPWAQLDRDDTAAAAARIYALGNVAHPYREGNGRALKIFVNHVAAQAGYEFDFDAIDKDVWNQRSMLSMPDLGAHEPHPDELAPVFAHIITDLPAPAPAIDPALLEQARNAARLAGIDNPRQPGTGATHPRPHTPKPASRPRGRDTDYGR
ncbi:Fic/DOC family protein [Williamsia sp. MIQD14]|uniref:Fic/DOC family protein n=1 Tax=Williamsia sp. MIQD14 TaxID=3425703 RepID=UPI003D9FFF0E